MKRALSVKDILDKKYHTFPFEGEWKAAFGNPERVGVWFVWGNSGNGKSSFVMQLCKELCKYDRVVYDSLEEGSCKTVQDSLRRHGMSEVSRKLAFIQEDMETLKTRLRQRQELQHHRSGQLPIHPDELPRLYFPEGGIPGQAVHLHQPRARQEPARGRRRRGNVRCDAEDMGRGRGRLQQRQVQG